MSMKKIANLLSNMKKHTDLSVLKKYLEQEYPDNPALQPAIFYKKYHNVILRHSVHKNIGTQVISPKDILYLSQDSWGGKLWVEVKHFQRLKQYATKLYNHEFKDYPFIAIRLINSDYIALDHHRVASAKLMLKNKLLCKVEEVILNNKLLKFNNLFLEFKNHNLDIRSRGVMSTKITFDITFQFTHNDKYYNRRWLLSYDEMCMLNKLFEQNCQPKVNYQNKIEFSKIEKICRFFQGKNNDVFEIPKEQWICHEIMLIYNAMKYSANKLKEAPPFARLCLTEFKRKLIAEAAVHR